ncbi:hypothetical protein BDR03DRAFT_121756 [Suillus americanus]|nr:hypothetical protein BDR03DRAFT_121756 [Suillus americanus]
MSGVAPKLFTSPFIPSLLHLLSATARSMHSTSSRSSPAHADTDLPTNENAIDANAVTEEPAMSIKVDFHENSTLEQASDSGIEPNNTNENPAVSIEGSLAKNM